MFPTLGKLHLGVISVRLELDMAYLPTAAILLQDLGEKYYLKTHILLWQIV